ncbi:MAG TPA: IS110 family transposase [Actinocrinis sp.]|uniref:IS110 family transposase n=1 Tax=Actinocrinis sp. TaxID=1920516 RepID=UPI002DDCD8C2|nr:IS110 family transposase [Actinocrinis sp.]HEV2343238.1 IS110 family transposase [Actinocrinis sp.]
MTTKSEAHDEVLYLRAAGVDVGKRFVVACARTPNPTRSGRWELETERFDTIPRELRRLRDWLIERRVEVVALEATSDYWRAVFYPLQDAGLNLMLVNPAHLRGIRGRKSDPSDAAFLARAAASGMVLASFVPARSIRELRDLTRRRTEVTADRGREVQRLEKELEDTGMKLTAVLSNVVGVSSRRILNALIDGERDPARLADLAVHTARGKIPALIEALQGSFTEHHAFMCRHYLDQIDHLAAVVAALDARIAALVREHDQDIARLDSIPGIGRAAAEVIIAETGGDMTAFATAGHLASWIGVCPGMHESAGVAKSGHTRHGNANLKRILGVAAMAAIKKRDSYYTVYYRRIAARRGRQRALVAVMHKLVIAIWQVLTRKIPHQDLGAHYFTRHDPARAIRQITRQANALGLTVRFDPIAA